MKTPYKNIYEVLKLNRIGGNCSGNAIYNRFKYHIIQNV